MPKLTKQFTTSCSLLSTWNIISRSENLFSGIGGMKADTKADRVDVDQMVEMSKSGQQHLNFAIQIEELSGTWRGKGVKDLPYKGTWVLCRKYEGGTAITFTMEYPTAPQVIPGPIVDLTALKRRFQKQLNAFVEALKERIEIEGEGKIIDVRVSSQ